MTGLAFLIAVCALALVLRQRVRIRALESAVRMLRLRPSDLTARRTHDVDEVAPAATEPPPPHELPQAPLRTTPAPPPPARDGSLEAKFGTTVSIWIGAVAFALAGIFLVKYMAEHGLLGPLARVLLATAFGFVLLGVAWRVRTRRISIAQGLAGAGVVVLSGSVWASSALYGFLSPLAAIVAQIVVTAIAVLASLRFGAPVAVLGFSGGFLVPALVGVASIGPTPIFAWLAVLLSCFAAFARQRAWWWVAPLGGAFAFAWVIAWQAMRPDGGALLAPFALFAVATVLGALPRPRRVLTVQSFGDDPTDYLRALPLLATAGALWVLLRELGDSEHAASQWAWLAVLGLGALFLATRAREHASLVWLAAIASGAKLIAACPPVTVAPPANLPIAIAGHFLLFAIGADFAGRRPRAAQSLIAFVPFASAAFATRALAAADLPLAWPAVLGALALIALVVAVRPPARGTSPRLRETGLWLAIAVLAGHAIHDGLPRDLRMLAFALGTPALAVLAWRRGLPLLAWAAGAFTLAQLALLVDEFGDRLVEAEPPLANLAFTALLVTMLAAAGASRALARAERGMRHALVQQDLAIALGCGAILCATAQVDHALAIGDTVFLVVATVGACWLAFASALLRFGPRVALLGTTRVGHFVATLALFVLGPVAILFVNPLWMHARVGAMPVLNGVTLAFGAGSAITVLVARQLAARGASVLARAAACVAFAAGFAGVSLTVRHAFHGTFLDGPAPERGELYAYSAVWLLYGVSLLAAGIRRGSHPMRQAALLAITAAVVKVFVVDASHLDGLWRVLSFFGLGVCGIGLAWVYQRVVTPGGPPIQSADGGDR
ncbi:MAG: DUF2339 domain-containing protein [Planctomycetes bacterium]|nr:DUF2339 domain-containing protein [Planctomycetota bacterium]